MLAVAASCRLEGEGRKLVDACRVDVFAGSSRAGGCGVHKLSDTPMHYHTNPSGCAAIGSPRLQSRS